MYQKKRPDLPLDHNSLMDSLLPRNSHRNTNSFDMNAMFQPSSFFIGWNVGGWNCDKNGKSRDALSILDTNLSIVGQPWRGNLRKTINEATSATEFLCKLLSLCAVESPRAIQVTMAIDTPLGFSEAFGDLVTGIRPVEVVGSSEENPYLFRASERFFLGVDISLYPRSKT